MTSHDPKRINFSENTAIHESLIVARRPGDERAPTRFVSLARMPQDTHEAILLSDLINRGQSLGEWGTENSWPWPRVRDGDWSAAQFYDGALANAVHDLAALAGTVLAPAGILCRIEPEGRRVRDAFLRNPPPDAPWTVPILWDHPTEIQTEMNAEADVFGAPKPGRVDYAKHLQAKASRLLIVNRLYTHQVRVSACYASVPLLGSSWTPVTPGSLTLHSKNLSALGGIPHQESLRCFMREPANSPTRDLPLLLYDLYWYPIRTSSMSRLSPTPSPRLVRKHYQPWPQMHDCPNRAILDQAAAQVLRVDGRTIADWRKRIAREPTVFGKLEGEALLF